MMLPLRHLVLAALFTLSHASTASASDGPNKLDECTACPPIYQTMVKCQKIKRPGGIGDEITNCICIPNSSEDGWYPYILQCRDCLSSGSSEFFGNLASMMTQLFTSCTNPGGNVVSDGNSICASNAMWDLCASLKDGSDGELSWASFEKFRDPSQNSNATQLLNIEAPDSEEESTTISSTKSVVSKTSSTSITTGATGTGSEAPSTATDSPSATDATTPGPSSSTPSSSALSSPTPSSPTDSSSAHRLSQGSQTGYALVMLAAAGLVGVLV